MTQIYHLNCVKIVSRVVANACGHCLLIKEDNKLILIDTGIGLLDTLNPIERIGQELIIIVGYKFKQNLTAIRHIKSLNLNPENVTDCVISHLDNDHIGGLSDFPNATVHLGIEEYNNYISGNPRYLKIPLAHNPKIITYEKSNLFWFGFEARKISINIKANIYLIPLFGHTLGHCGIAIKSKKRWLFYIADAYYLRLELNDSEHPVNEIAKISADSNDLRIETLKKIRRLINDYPEIDVYSYHDINEFKKLKKREKKLDY